MKVTRDVILDLLPLYLAGEVSEDTRVLVESFLVTDPRLAKLVEQAAQEKLPADIPIPTSVEDEMKDFRKTKLLVLQHNLFLLLAVGFTVLWILLMVLSTASERVSGAPSVFPLIGAVLFWAAFSVVNSQLNEDEEE